MAAPTGYELVDCGDGRRLERFGERLVDRPAPTAIAPRGASPTVWRSADLRFERDGGWVGGQVDPWVVELDPIRVEIRPGPAGQLGLYPEHTKLWPWLREVVAERPTAEVLHLFASTGATTLALTAAGARVTHVDGARSSVGVARRNAMLSGLEDRPIRWIVDDAIRYTEREARRGRRYDGLVLDPPSYGHAPDGRRWEIASALPDLLDVAQRVAAPDAFVLLTAHSVGLEADDLATALRDAFGHVALLAAEPIELVATSGAVLPLGAGARMIRR
jgi:23S rRNA (cytosine1962-C5)-methyltransferase